MVNSTQQAIDIAGIKDGVIVMNDGSYRLLLQVAATNFALKSEQEQNSIVFQYQSFLNSLHFPVEIVISSRRLDLTPYIAKIEKLSEKQTTELIKMQTLDYIDFLKKLVEIANIMKKTFYTVVSFTPVDIKKIGFLGSLFGNKKSAFEHLKISDADFKAHTEQLRQRANTIASGLGSMGLHCFQLSTEQLIELFYLSYNPDEAAKERFEDATLLASPIIMSAEEKKSDQDTTEGTGDAEQTEDIIDNAGMDAEQRRSEAQAKKQEAEKNGEKIARTPAPATPAATAPVAAQTQPVNSQAPTLATTTTPVPTPTIPPQTNSASATPSNPAPAVSPTTNNNSSS